MTRTEWFINYLIFQKGGEMGRGLTAKIIGESIDHALTNGRRTIEKNLKVNYPPGTTYSIIHIEMTKHGELDRR